MIDVTRCPKGFAPKVHEGVITLSDKVRISDPCNDPDTWCAGTADIKPGEYDCYKFMHNDPAEWEGVIEDDCRVAAIEIRHKDCVKSAYTEHLPIDVGVDSGQAGFYDEPYFLDVKKDPGTDAVWYDRVCGLTYTEGFYIPGTNPKTNNNVTPEKILDLMNDAVAHGRKIEPEYLTEEYAANTYKRLIALNRDAFIGGGFHAATIDGKGFVSSSGWGDGSYDCFASRDSNGQIDALLLIYLLPYGMDDETMPEEYKEPAKFFEKERYFDED